MRRWRDFAVRTRGSSHWQEQVTTQWNGSSIGGGEESGGRSWQVVRLGGLALGGEAIAGGGEL
tara:strand:+ start:309 stop:497 length:189 start_codon:yes stop_codon:yes gene_type:complete